MSHEDPPCPTLAEWMELSLYHPGAGYYASGRVRFGDREDFWTYPERLSPTFGRLLANHLPAMMARLEAAGLLAAGEPFTVVELGAGDGTLARDICDAALESDALRDRLRYRIGERAPALQRVQAETCREHMGARLEHLPQGAADDVPRTAPWKGLLLSNELIDVYPHDRVRPLDGTRLVLEPWVPVEELEALGVAPTGGARAGWVRLGLSELRECVSRAAALESPPRIRVEPRWEPLGDDPDIAAYLRAVAPVTAHRATTHPSSPELLVSSRVERLYRWIGHNLTAGWALMIDYGGTALHALDPLPTLPHLRTFPQPESAPEHAYAEGDAAPLLGWPGTQDVTVEVDMTHLAVAGAAHGLRAVHHGPQGHLWVPEPPQVDGAPALDPMARPERARVELELRRKYGLSPIEAAKAAWETARAFRDASPGFRMLLQQTTNPPEPYPIPHPTHPVMPDDLPLVRAEPSELCGALAAAGLPPEVADALKPHGCLISDLDDRGLRDHTGRALEALAAAGAVARRRPR